MKIYQFMFGVSEKEVLTALLGLKRLPYRGMTTLNYKRHLKAIDRLKELKIIYKDENNILKIHSHLIIQVKQIVT